MKALLDAELVELVGTDSRRGGIQYWYAATPQGRSVVALIKQVVRSHSIGEEN